MLVYCSNCERFAKMGKVEFGITKCSRCHEANELHTVDFEASLLNQLCRLNENIIEIGDQLRIRS